MCRVYVGKKHKTRLERWVGQSYTGGDSECKAKAYGLFFVGNEELEKIELSGSLSERKPKS